MIDRVRYRAQQMGHWIIDKSYRTTAGLEPTASY